MSAQELIAWAIVISAWVFVFVPIIIAWLAEGTATMGYWESVAKGNLAFLVIIAFALAANAFIWALDVLFAP